MTIISYDELNAARAASYAQAQAKAPQGIQETAYRAINSLFSKVSKAVSPFFARLKETSLNAIESIKDLSNKAVEWIKDYPNTPKFANIGAIIGLSIAVLGFLSPIITIPLALSTAASLGIAYGILSVGAVIVLYSLKESS